MKKLNAVTIGPKIAGPIGNEGEQLIFDKYSVGKVSNDDGSIDHFEIRKVYKNGKHMLKGYYVSKTYVGDLFQQFVDEVLDTLFKLDEEGNMQCMLGGITYGDTSYIAEMSAEKIVIKENGKVLWRIIPSKNEEDNTYTFTQAGMLRAYSTLSKALQLNHLMVETDWNKLAPTIAQLVEKL